MPGRRRPTAAHPAPAAGPVGLTEAEADVALLALDGHGVKPISERVSLSQATLKTHLQHIFDKTGPHRRAELVRLPVVTQSVRR